MAAQPPELDPLYFACVTWAERVSAWMDASAGSPFVAANERVVRDVVSDPRSGARVVVNLGPTALAALLTGERYRNLYERPLVGGERPTPSRERLQVDDALELDGPDVYFGALAVGGTGVAFYGEYCAVLVLDAVDPEPRLFDRDSYDILFPPFEGREDLSHLVEALRGTWEERFDMLVLSVLPGLTSGPRIVTSGTVAQAVLRDQQFVEVHLHVPSTGTGRGGFELSDIEEVRESPDVVTTTAWLRRRADAGHRLSDVEQKLMEDREGVEELLALGGVRRRVVTQHDRGYQWA
ncbi:hypothetical protein [Isoptericola sp. NPDC019482]|uniref:hypothetical protein n=1 Tax=Isoptericola sp. NPDC019482 TaxID=3154688 RepID=UPI00346D78AF